MHGLPLCRFSRGSTAICGLTFPRAAKSRASIASWRFPMSGREKKLVSVQNRAGERLAGPDDAQAGTHSGVDLGLKSRVLQMMLVSGSLILIGLRTTRPERTAGSPTHTRVPRGRK